ncbi:hypothetical protein PVAND_006996 [Polypedilum vanderplanki]|uniref:Uncharacterized protein n=1 Tax=Polypedilum vanderplanki TaxID=319348 RepID=A0A9J6C4W5_POLVA|nr:hypothetical protein PVAND_006996 [Polypedilum vanderplanki]
MQNVITFINKKDELLKKDYKFRFIFENITVEENRELYFKKLNKLEERMEMTDVSPKNMQDFFKCSCIKTWKKEEVTGVKTIHCASIAGFSDTDIGFIGEVHTNDSMNVEALNFLNAFEKIVSDENAIPNKTAIVLSTDEHHMTKIKRNGSFLRSAEKKRKLAAECKGQQTIEKYFQSKKVSAQKIIKNDEPKFKVEEIISRTRGDSNEIKILWCPNVELNPCSYVSVLLNNEIMRYLNDNENVTLIDACRNTINSIPNDVWITYCDFIKDLERTLLEDYKPKNNLKENKIPGNNEN